MEVNQDRDTIWSVNIAGGDLVTDSQIIDSTDEENTDEDGSEEFVIAEEDCILYLCPSQQTLSLVEENIMDIEESGLTEDSTTIAKIPAPTTTANITAEAATTTTKVTAEAPNATAKITAAVQNSVSSSHPTEICYKYTMGLCRFGVDGLGCQFDHPRSCKRLLRSGQWGRNGCSKGNDCESYHPICRQSLMHNFCTRGTSCRFQHPPGWTRLVGDISLLKK